MSAESLRLFEKLGGESSFSGAMLVKVMEELMDARMRELEKDLRRMELANATLSVSVEHLATSVRALTETVTVLRDTMNRGRGALWLGVVAAGSVGAGISAIIKKLLLGV